MSLAAPATVFGASDDHTATEPPEYRGLARDEVRLLVASPGGVTHARFRDLPQHLRAGDLLVVNTSATLPAELDGRRSGKPVVVHLATDLGDGTWVAELRSAPGGTSPVLDATAGDVIQLPARARMRLVAPYPRPDSSPTGSGNRLWRVQLVRAVSDPAESALTYLYRHGRPIAYGYLRHRFDLSDYQTIFATHPGSAEMPSAARPFSHDLVTRLVTAGIPIAPITLHTGVSSQDVGEAPQAEWYEVPAPTAGIVASTHRAGGRVIAVGTTVTRALESAVGGDGTIAASSGWTELVIDPCRGVRVVDGLITGWHNPEASHLLLVEAVVGSAVTQRAYDGAVAEGYLWHEFGDVGLLLRR
jgi:S-adenosylmethionine:tRNA ribosyltransferase-isomerase